MKQIIEITNKCNCLTWTTATNQKSLWPTYFESVLVREQYTVIDWVQGQQQFCLTRGRICCPKPQAEGNRSFRGSNKTAVVLEANL